MSKEVSIGLIGYRFMGKAHANAYRQVPAFLDPQLRPRLKLVCGRNETAVREFATRFGWEEQTTNWREVISRPAARITAGSFTFTPLLVFGAIRYGELRFLNP